MRVDRRVQRTRQLLQDSLIALILERGYDDITIQEITDHANLGRATFYLHYRDKEELLVKSLEAIYDDLVENVGSKSILLDPNSPPPALIAFQHAGAHRDLYRIMLRGQGAATIVVQIRVYLAQLIQQRLQQLFQSRIPPVPYEIIAQHVTGSLLALIGWWIEHDSPYSAEEMAEMFRQLNTQALLTYFRNISSTVAE